MFERLYLRIYASKWGRTQQRDEEAVWSDAKYMIEILVVIPLVGLLKVGWMIGGDVFPNSIGKFEIPAAGQGAILFGVWLGLEFYLRQIAAKYKGRAFALEKFNSSTDRAKINIAMATSVACFIAELVVVWIHK